MPHNRLKQLKQRTKQALRQRRSEEEPEQQDDIVAGRLRRETGEFLDEARDVTRELERLERNPEPFNQQVSEASQYVGANIQEVEEAVRMLPEQQRQRAQNRLDQRSSAVSGGLTANNSDSPTKRRAKKLARKGGKKAVAEIDRFFSPNEGDEDVSIDEQVLSGGLGGGGGGGRSRQRRRRQRGSVDPVTPSNRESTLEALDELGGESNPDLDFTGDEFDPLED